MTTSGPEGSPAGLAGLPGTPSTVRIGPLVLEERLARGGMAEVWRAHLAPENVDVPDRTLVFSPLGRHAETLRHQTLAVKRLDPSLLKDVDFVEMFRDEARLALAFRHPGVVRTWALIDDHPAGTPEELALVMELVPGQNLARVMRSLRTSDAPITIRESLLVARELALALFHVHTVVDDDTGQPLGVIHRDVSPQNILLDPAGRVVLIDFGVARAAARLTRTQSGVLKGKAAYMAPEHVRGEAIDARADQFAWGIVLWELLCGRHLFLGPDEMHVLNRIRDGDITPPSTMMAMVRQKRRDRGERLAEGERSGPVEAGAPSWADLDRLVMTALCPHPDGRFTSLAEAAAACDVLLGFGTGDGSGDDVAGVVAEASRTSLVALAARASAAAAQGVTHNDVAEDTAERQAPQHNTAARAKTRVIAADRADALVVEETAPPPERSLSAPRLLPIAAGVLVVAVVVVGALQCPGPSAPTPTPVIVMDAGKVALPTSTAATTKEVTALREALQAAPAHPCRTELLDEVLAPRGMGADVLAILQLEAAACIAGADDVDDARTALDTRTRRGLMPKAPTKRTSARGRRSFERELRRRGELALVAGDTKAAVQLFEARAARTPEDLEARRQLLEAYRRDGQTAAAGVEARAIIAKSGDSAVVARWQRWLSLNDLPPGPLRPDLASPASSPAVETTPP